MPTTSLTRLTLSSEDKRKIAYKLNKLKDESKLSINRFLKKHDISWGTYLKLTNMSGKYYSKELMDSVVSNLGITYKYLGIDNVRIGHHYSNNFANKLRKLMNCKKIPCSKLAKILDFKKQRINQIMLSGCCKEAELYKLAKFFNKKPEYFEAETTEHRRLSKHVHNSCIDKKLTARKLELLRVSNGLTMKDVADKTHIQLNMILKVETGQLFCNKDTFEKLLKFYNITSKDFDNIDLKKNKSKLYKDVIYFVGNDDYIKIGTSIADIRINVVMKGAPFSTKLLAKIPGSKRLEAKIHKCLAPYRSNSEWFHYDPPVKRFCKLFLEKINNTDEDPMDLIDPVWRECNKDVELDGLNAGDY